MELGIGDTLPNKMRRLASGVPACPADDIAGSSGTNGCTVGQPPPQHLASAPAGALLTRRVASPGVSDQHCTGVKAGFEPASGMLSTPLVIVSMFIEAEGI